MRLQIVALPQQPVGVDSYRTPFLIVLDECSPEFVEALREVGPQIKIDTRAQSVLVFEQRVEVVPAWSGVADLDEAEVLATLDAAGTPAERVQR